MFRYMYRLYVVFFLLLACSCLFSGPNSSLLIPYCTVLHLLCFALLETDLIKFSPQQKTKAMKDGKHAHTHRERGREIRNQFGYRMCLKTQMGMHAACSLNNKKNQSKMNEKKRKSKSVFHTHTHKQCMTDRKQNICWHKVHRNIVLYWEHIFSILWLGYNFMQEVVECIVLEARHE